MITMYEEIALGLEWLDANHPRWIDTIDVNLINQRRPSSCVLGQTMQHAYGDTTEPMRYWIDVLRHADLSVVRANEFGFGQSEPEYTDAWKAAITARLELLPQPQPQSQPSIHITHDEAANAELVIHTMTLNGRQFRGTWGALISLLSDTTDQSNPISFEVTTNG